MDVDGNRKRRELGTQDNLCGKEERRRTDVCQTYLTLLLSLSLSLLSSLPVGEKQSQESYGKTQATRNEGQNPCASKDAAAVAGAAVEMREGEEEQKVRGGERANEKKQRHLRRKGGTRRSGRERKRVRDMKGVQRGKAMRERETRLADAEKTAEEGKRERRVRLLRVSCACSTLPSRPLPSPPLDRLT